MTRARTPDERFILSLFDTVKGRESRDEPVDRYEVGKQASITPKAADAICRLLIQANFIKKREGSLIMMTRNGEELAERLLNE